MSDHLASPVVAFFALAGLGAYSLQRRRRDLRLLFVRITARREVASPLGSRI
ncbi:MAG TPA: MYXO-CTERM sorting domain-containing protein [Acidimicrobiia bacterium]